MKSKRQQATQHLQVKTTIKAGECGSCGGLLAPSDQVDACFYGDYNACESLGQYVARGIVACQEDTFCVVRDDYI